MDFVDTPLKKVMWPYSTPEGQELEAVESLVQTHPSLRFGVWKGILSVERTMPWFGVQRL